ncbi:YbaK/EbsC family protein [Thermophilibacter sp. ET337]|uniref:YbaK/EbsC family protein n=1 Tax=Thermophilibacter sp. ET337 TaxID=2973084 RepID=UPI0021ABD202|nr:YbaK/EbsC family protein [Thermophilibacter sp. ET337]MCR8907291.1 YbaK/EbsC family protein [Thermophilibacter sp. ET337]
MSIERARAHLARFGLAERVREFDVSSATVELAAAAVGVEPARIAKTLSFMVGETPTLILFAGDARVNNQAFKATFHTKAKMLTAEQAAELVGHAVGGVCPFGVNEGVNVYLDESLRRFETVWPAAGSSNSAVELTCDELELASGARSWVDVGKGWREGE